MQDLFTIEIAGLVTRVQPLFMSTREYCRQYLSESIPDFFVEVTKNDLLLEQEMAEIEAVEEGIPIRKFTDSFLERATIQRKIARELLNRDTILLHGSTVGVDGAAYMFTGPCGTGKSTHTRLWREVFGSRATMINDDKPFLRITSSGVWAYGSPWSGKHGLDSNVSLPLMGICFLRRGAKNSIRVAQPEDYLSELLHQCFIPEDASGAGKAQLLVETLSKIVLLWEMECTKDPQAALISYEAMSGYSK
jgi:hypothetical protein